MVIAVYAIIGTLFFFLVLVPLRIAFEVAASRKSTGSRFGVLLVMVLMFPVVPLLYGALFSERATMRRLASGALVLAAAAIVVAVAAAPAVYAWREGRIVAAFEKVAKPAAGSQEQLLLERMREALDVLHYEQARLPRLAVRSRLRFDDLQELLEIFLRDGRLTASESEEWLQEFDRRRGTLHPSFPYTSG